MVYVNSLFSATNSGHSMNKANEKSDENNGFFDILSKNMGQVQELQSQNPRQALKSADVDKENLANTTRKSYKSDRPMKTTDAKGEVNAGETQNINTNDTDVHQVEEISTSDEQKEQHESILLVIDQIIAMLQNNIIVDYEQSQPLQSDESSMQLFETIQTGIEKSLEELLAIVENAPKGVSELTQDLVHKLEQMLSMDSTEIISENDGTAQLQDLIGKMLNEAKAVKANQTDNVNTEDNAHKGTDIAATMVDESQSIGKIETTENKQQADFDFNEKFQDEAKEERPSLNDVINAHGRPKLEDITSLEDYITTNNVVENTQEIEVFFTNMPKMPMPPKADVLHQIVENTKMFIDQDKSEMVIQLKPEGLGKVQLNVIHERGEIVAEFTAENEHVKSILESNMQLLKDSLEESGIDIQSLSVSVGQHGNTDDNQSDGYKQKGTQGQIANDYSMVSDVNQSLGYSRQSDKFYGFQESAINLTA